jgi:hypothetical protein
MDTIAANRICEGRVTGLQATERQDGSIAFAAAAGAPPALVMPKPFMMDSGPDSSSPYGTAWSGAVAHSGRDLGQLRVAG